MAPANASHAPLPGRAPIRSSLIDKLLRVPYTLAALITGLRAAFLDPLFLRGPHPKSRFRRFVFGMLRFTLAFNTEGREQLAIVPTAKGYAVGAKALGVQKESVTLDDGVTKVHFLGGRQGKKKTILYAHGGGYVLGLSDGHVKWLGALLKDLQAQGKNDVNVAIVEYRLAPYGQYPAQLMQFERAYRWLIESEGRQPSDITIGGDSAGGQICMTLISHLLHPHPQLPAPSEAMTASPLAGAILISPWTSFTLRGQSPNTNARSDYITPRGGTRWRNLFLGSAQPDAYNEPLQAPANWFTDLDKAVKSVWIYIGVKELMADSLEEFTKIMETKSSDATVYRDQDGAHIDLIMDYILDYSEGNDATRAVGKWLAPKV